MIIALVPNPTRDKKLILTKLVAQKLEEYGATVQMSNEFVKSGVRCNYVSPDALFASADSVITVGGDGTIIHTAVDAAEHGLPVLGINCGKVGFIAELERDEIDKLELLCNGYYSIEERLMLDITAASKHYTCLNDAVITRGKVACITDLTLYRGGRKVDSYRSDGIIVATPTGSTAYSMSAGGPIVEPTLNCMLVTPICSHSLASRTLVFDTHQSVEVVCKSNGTFLTTDGSISVPLRKGEKVKFEVGSKSARLIRLKERDFFDVLNQKLNRRVETE